MRTHTTTATAVSAVLLLALTACGTSDTTTTDAPDYTVVSKKDDTVVVEVDTTKSLRAVFDDAVKNLKGEEDAGWWVVINCSTGGTKSADNRLANGKYALGRLGAAQTGLDEGATEFSVNKGRKCPVTPEEEAERDAMREKATSAPTAEDTTTRR
jgi:outer membrane lipoprotein SlyB